MISKGLQPLFPARIDVKSAKKSKKFPKVHLGLFLLIVKRKKTRKGDPPGAPSNFPSIFGGFLSFLLSGKRGRSRENAKYLKKNEGRDFLEF